MKRSVTILAQVAILGLCVSYVAADCSGSVLRYRSRGRCVRVLQRSLGIDIDGIFGQQTQRAVRSFQSRNGMDVDGIVGRDTWASLTTGRRGTGGSSGSSCGSGNKVDETLPLILTHEGRCQNSRSDTGNHFSGRIGYTCMGIIPKTGWRNRSKFRCHSSFSGHKANFVKFCYDWNPTDFRSTAKRIYIDDYFGGCMDLAQPAFYVCADIAVNSGPATARRLRQEISGSSSSKVYARRLNDLHRAHYRRISTGSKRKFLRGWLNRADARDRFISNC